ncbi:trigger factor [Candidatus Nanosynbacter lyticus]|uniref:trigger factor n=1 Tax=Candidatus Nanosynbacter lyticus TaxID=2093824 RepID=UPI0025567E0A|nr:trigger factor [Candidatus Nanosynbacter lyticus]WLD46862.1 trigger factor [Candidatus Nanosynbacter lyticus]
MKTTVKKLSDTKVCLTITLGADELNAAEQVALTKMARDLKVPGFRKGKVPVSVAAKHVNPMALQEQVLDNALSKAVAEAFMNEKLQALERPSVEVKKFVPNQEVEFTAEATVVPPVKLGDYKKLKAKPQAVKVDAKDVDEIIERMQQNFVDKAEVKRAAQEGDEAIIDFVGKKDGVAFDGGSAKDFALKLGGGQFIPGFEEGVVGHKAGETFDLDLEFPKDYHAENLAGAKVMFSVTLHKVNELKLPELNDEFAAKCGPFTDVKELKADIKREITTQKEREAKEKLKDELVAELADSSKVALPELLIDDQLQSIEQDLMQNLSYRGLTMDSYLKTQGFKDKADWQKKEARPAAEKRVKAGLVLAELSKELGVEVSREELDRQISTFKQQYGKDAKLAARFDDPNVHRDIANRMITDKTIDKLVELNSK